MACLLGDQSVIGRAIIVHEKADDGCTQPTGNSGARYAQCVIGVGSMDPLQWNPAAVAVTVPAPTQVNCPTTPSATPKASLAVQHTVELLFAFVLLVLAL